jgi:hypothetical protein
MNGVVSRPGAPVTADLAGEIIDWFRERDLPASWLVEGDDEALARILVDQGARSETSGEWAGRPIGSDPFRLSGGGADVEITPVRSAADLDDWLDVAGRCGWLCDDTDRAGPEP